MPQNISFYSYQHTKSVLREPRTFLVKPINTSSWPHWLLDTIWHLFPQHQVLSPLQVLPSSQCPFPTLLPRAILEYPCSSKGSFVLGFLLSLFQVCPMRDFIHLVAESTVHDEDSQIYFCLHSRSLCYFGSINNHHWDVSTGMSHLKLTLQPESAFHICSSSSTMFQARSLGHHPWLLSFPAPNPLGSTFQKNSRICSLSLLLSHDLGPCHYYLHQVS